MLEKSFLACRGSQKLHFESAGHRRFVLSRRINFFRDLRNQGRMQIFEKMSQRALNHVLTLPRFRSRRELPESSGFFEKGAIFVG